MVRTDLFWCLLVLAVLSVQPAHAYLDPGTGSYVLQLMMASFFSATWAVKKLVCKIRR